MNYKVAILSLLISNYAYGTTPNNPNTTNNAYGGASNSYSSATAIGVGGTSVNTNITRGGKATANSSNNLYSGENSQTVVFENPGNVRYSGSYDVRTVGVAPDVSTNNTAPCRIAIGAGGGWVGGALSFFGSVLDEGCDIWRDHQNLSNAGFKDAASSRLCDKPEIAKLLAHCAMSESRESKNNPFNVR